jgi:formylglycine-generating enzyme required for sulfatase activity
MMNRSGNFLGIVILVFLAQSCSFARPRQSVNPSEPIPPVQATLPVATSVILTQDLIADVDPTATQFISVSDPVVDVTALPHDFWMSLPVVPETISDKVHAIYEQGLRMGNNPNAFSKVGDCHSTNPYFLADYDLGPDVYDLGDYAYLQPTIDYFSGSFGRTSLAAKQGLSTAGVLASLWADWKQCNSNETPLDCEFRAHRPSFALISLGTNEAYDVKLDPMSFEPRLRRIIEHGIDQGVVPILSTKADNDEGDHYINQVTARLAMEYELPLWNYWKAVQSLPQHGMRSADHLTFAPSKSYTDFSQPAYLDYGMQMRNLTALQLLDMIRREITRSQIQTVATPTAQPTPAASVVYQEGATMVSPMDGMTLMYIPADTFEMGSTVGNPDEAPIHTVTLDAYWMDRTEVTNAMFANFLNANGNRSAGGVPWLDLNEPLVSLSNENEGWQVLPGKEDYPIVGVSWYGAKAYCEWAVRDLPTEAQWEYAAKGSDGFRFPWGNSAPNCAYSRYWGCGNKPAQVGGLSAGMSPFGVYDLAGNAAEWVNDRYAADYYEQSPLQNPAGPINGYYRVIRGGDWGSDYISLQTTHRDWAGADEQESNIGFRCALNP